MDDIQKNIALMTVNGNRLELPRDVIFENYAQIKRTMLKAGGTYKQNGFEFPTDPAEIQRRLLDGEQIDDKKAFQFYQTPVWLAEEMVELAKVEARARVLEPSAGLGRLVAPAQRLGADVTAIELDPANLRHLHMTFENVRIIGFDFLKIDDFGEIFDVALMNPPFAQLRDIAHVRHAYRFLKPGGRLIAIMSEGVFFRQDAPSTLFRKFLDEAGGTSIQLPEDTFKESGTGVRARIVSLTKPARVGGRVGSGRVAIETAA